MPDLLIKSLGLQDSKRFSLAVAYPALRKDGHGEYATAEVIEQAAWDYLADHREVGLYHADGLVGQGTVVESTIWRGPDWDCEAVDGSTQTIRPGDWLLGIQWEPRPWALIKSGRVDGLSMQGRYRRRVHQGET
jgi:hypothetical protein